MGIDAALFAREAKHYFYFDRQWNLLEFDPDEDSSIGDISSQLAGREAGFSPYDVVEAEDVLKLIEYKRKHQPSGWLDGLERFVREHVTDVFFTRNDHERDSFHDVIERGGYTEVRYE